MRDCMNTVTDFGNVREAVCVSTQKIMDACRDQDCMEDIPVFLTTESQNTLDCATSVKARSAELLFADVDVEPVGYQDGYYYVSIQYYYRVIADAVLCSVKPVTIYGLATYNKRAMLYGGEGCARTFTSDGLPAGEQPRAVLEAVNPMILSAKIVDHCHHGKPVCTCGESGLPEIVTSAFDDALMFSGMTRQLLVTLGQFSIVRLERQTQLLIPSYDYCMPSKRCSDNGGDDPERPCEAFSKLQFPVNAFFPTGEDTAICGTCGTGSSCGCHCAGEAAEEAGQVSDAVCSRPVPVAGQNGCGRKR